MTLRTLLIAVFPVFLSGAIFAQDKIYKTDGGIIDAKVRSVGSRMIVFLKYDNLGGPEYTIPKNEVTKIKYENGSEQTIGADDNGSRSLPPGIQDRRAVNEALKGKYGSTVLAVAPIQFTENGLVGISVSYEKAIDKNDVVSFYLPAILEFNSGSGSTDVGKPNNPDPMFYLMPGLKIYPTGGYGLAKYAIGPSLVIAAGQKTVDQGYNINTGYDNYGVESHFLIGMMINQSLNINPTPHLYIGSEFGFGITYLNQLAGASDGIGGLVQFSFKVGYRY